MAAPEPQRRRVAIPSFDLTDSDESELEDDAAGPQQAPSREGVDKRVGSPPTIADAGAPAPAASAPAPDGARTTRRIIIPSFDIDDSSDDSGATDGTALQLPQGQSQQARAIEKLDTFSAMAPLSQPPGVFGCCSAAGSLVFEDSAHGSLSAAVQRKFTLGGEAGWGEGVEKAACPICNAMFTITDLPSHVEECMPGDEEWRGNTRGLGCSQDEGFRVVHQDRQHIGQCPVASSTQYNSTATSSLLTPSTVSCEARRKDVDIAQMQSGREEGKDINTGPGRFKMKLKGRMEEREERGQPHRADSARSRIAGRDIHTGQDKKTGPGRRGSSRVGARMPNSIVATTRASAASIAPSTHSSVDAAHFYSTPLPLPHFHAPRTQLPNPSPADAGGGSRERGITCAIGREVQVAHQSGGAVGSKGAGAQDAVLSGPGPSGERNEAGAGSGRFGFRDKGFGLKDLRWSNIWSRLDSPAPRSAPRALHSACKRRTSNAANARQCRASKHGSGTDTSARSPEGARPSHGQGSARSGGGGEVRQGGDCIAASGRWAGGTGCEDDGGVPGTLATGRPAKSLLAKWIHCIEPQQGPAVKPSAPGGACGCDTIPRRARTSKYAFWALAASRYCPPHFFALRRARCMAQTRWEGLLWSGGQESSCCLPPLPASGADMKLKHCHRARRKRMPWEAPLDCALKKRKTGGLSIRGVRSCRAAKVMLMPEMLMSTT